MIPRNLFHRKFLIVSGSAVLCASIALAGCEKAKAGWQVFTTDNKMENTKTEVAQKLEGIEGGGQIQTSITCVDERVNFEFLYDSGKSNEANPVGMMWKDYFGGQGVPVRVRIDNGAIHEFRANSENSNVANVYFLSDIGHLTHTLDILFSAATLQSVAESKTLLVELPLSDGRKPVIEINRDDPSLQGFLSDCRDSGFKEFAYTSQNKAPVCAEGDVFYADVNMVSYDQDGIHEQRTDGYLLGGEKITIQGGMGDFPKTLCKVSVEGDSRPAIVSRLDLLTADEWKKVPGSAEIDKKRFDRQNKKDVPPPAIIKFDPNEMADYNRRTCENTSATDEERKFACEQVKEAPLFAVCQDPYAAAEKRMKACAELDKLRNP